MKTKLSIGLIMLCLWQAAQPAILADYVFAENLSGNLAGAPEIEFLGKHVTYTTGSIQGLSVDALAIETGTGLKLDLSQWTVCDDYTLVIQGVLEFTNGYRKLIDFRDLSVDTGVYNRNGVLEYVSGQVGLAVSMMPNQYFQLVMTRDSAHMVSLYIDGELEFSFNDTGSETSMCFSDQFHFYVDDDQTSSEDPQGAVARITLYDHALSADEVAELELLDVIFFSDFEVIQQP